MADPTTRIEFRTIQVAALYSALSPQERIYLATWEADNLDGTTTATTDWPGWDRYIGPAIFPTDIYTKADIPDALRERVFRRDGFACLHCGATDNLSADHIFPEVRGGATTFDNLQTLCMPCNRRKGARV